MSNIRFLQSVLVSGVLIVLSVTHGVSAKTRKITVPEVIPHSIFTSSDVASLERRLSPFLENRRIRRHCNKNPADRLNPPLEADLMLLPKIWNQLSPQFKQLYYSTSSLPDSAERFESPGGHFEIYYFTSGFNSVAAGDNYRFSASDWRVRVDETNGIPDYIDETGFALDSCWSMEIDRFGLVPPRAFADQSHASDRYKVVVEQQDDGYYGLTYLQDKAVGVHGYPSTISLRNDWSGTDWEDLGYDQHPVSGLRVTCAHEFFHAIQYGMSWDVVLDVWLDDFPLSWTEGTAVCMEELAFDSINDYLQYSSSYFLDPGMSFFSPTTSDIVYSNAILLLYLSKFFPPGNSIEFIRTMVLTNYARRTPFHENLLTTASKSGKTWVELLHDFHIASFFTGNKADTTRFITDASRFQMRTANAQSQTNSIIREVGLNSTEHIRLRSTTFPQDTLSLFFTGDPSHTGSMTGTGWACSIILRRQNFDSTVTVPIASDCRGTATIPWWKTYEEAIIVITNGDPIASREVRLAFTNSTIPESPEIAVFPNPVSINRHQGTVRFRGNNISAISVRSISGLLIWNSPKIPQKSTEVTWNCKTESALKVAPGTYQVLITTDEGTSGSIDHLRRKLLVIP